MLITRYGNEYELSKIRELKNAVESVEGVKKRYST
jgi:hypothetical protein